MGLTGQAGSVSLRPVRGHVSKINKKETFGHFLKNDSRDYPLSGFHKHAHTRVLMSKENQVSELSWPQAILLSAPTLAHWGLFYVCSTILHSSLSSAHVQHFCVCCLFSCLDMEVHFQ